MSNPESLAPVDDAHWPDSLRHVFDDMRGQPINVHRQMAHHPELLGAWWDYRNHFVAGGTLGQRQAEIVILSVANALGNAYEWDSHVDRGLAAGLSPEEIRSLRDGVPVFEGADAVLVTMVEALLRDRHVPEGLLARARQHFDTRAIMDVIFLQGAYVTLGCLLDTFPVPLDDRVAERLDREGERIAGLRRGA